MSIAAPRLGAGRGFLAVVPRPGLAERLFVVALMVVYEVRLPQEWFTVLNPDDPSAVNESTGPLASLVFLAIAGVAVLIVLPRLDLVFQLGRVAPALTALAGYLVLSTFWSVDPGTTVRRSIAVALTVFVAMYLVIRFDREEILRYTALALAIGVWLNALFVFALPRYGITATAGQWDGVFSHKNQLGRAMAFALAVLLLQFAGSARSRLWALPTIGMAVVLLLGSRSKTALAATVLLVGLLLVFQLFRARRVLFGAVAVSLTGATVLAVMFATANLPFVADLLDRDVTLTGRTLLWEAVIPHIADAPLLGHGYSAFWQGWFSPAHDIWLLADWAPPNAHNAALDYLLELGIVGLALVLGYFGSALVRATRELRDCPGAAASLPIAVLSYQLLLSITESGVLDRSLSWLVICAMVFSVAVAQHARREAVPELSGTLR